MESKEIKINYSILFIRIACYALFINTTSLMAQKSVYVEYDFHKPSNIRVGYVGSDNDTVFFKKRVIKVKGSTPCEIKLANYNSEALQTVSSLRKGKNIDSASASNLTIFLNSFAALTTPSVGINFSNLLPKSRGFAQPKLEMAELYPNFDELLDIDQDDTLAALVKLDTIISNRLSEINRWRLVLSRLNQLRYNTNYSAKETKLKAEEVLTAFSTNASIIFKDEIKTSNIIRQLARNNSDYLNFALVSLQKQLENEPIARGKSSKLSDFFWANENIKEYKKYINSETEPEVRQILDDIVRSYQSIQLNTFESRMTLMIDDNTDLLQLSTYRVNDKGQLLSKEPIQNQPFFIKMSGNISIINTVGIGLIKFKEQPAVYSVVNSKIVSTPSDRILPSFTFYMHFIGSGHSSLKIGGHFGAGVPLSESKSINFQMGPTIVIGTQNAICLNLGVITGKVQRLGGGYSVGDIYASSTAIPIFNRYEIGYQIGLSFNLSSFVKK